MANAIDGLHLTLDGRVKDPAVFNETNLRGMMLKLVEDLDMQLIFGPVFKEVEVDPSKLTGDKFVDEGGISGYCMISTSHMSIHCWPLRRVFMADLFSCKGFDHERAIGTVAEFLNPTALNHTRIFRSPPP
jgi:S-adenosylmethionine decarboxylase